MQAADLVGYLDDYLDVARVPDYPGAHNGLQVECRRDVKLIVGAVDACRYTIEAAVELDADMLLVHHGLCWSPLAPLVGTAYRRFAPLLRTGTGVYSAHLPLDRHPEVGNNHVLCRILGLEAIDLWADYEGVPMGVIAGADATVAQIRARLDAALGVQSRLIGDEHALCRKVGIVTGGGSEDIPEAARLGLDLFITGEAPHHAYHTTVEHSLNVLLAGHYATETVGIRALCEHLAARFGLQWRFIDNPTGL